MKCPHQNEQSAYVAALFCVTLFLLFVLTSCTAEAAERRLLYFTQAGCPPCVAMKPAIDQLRREGLPVYVIDIRSGNGPADAKRYGVTGTPTCVVTDNDGNTPFVRSGIVSAVALRAALEVDRPQPVWTPHWNWSPPAAHHWAAVRINGGSGVYVEFEGVTGILTANHVGSSPIDWLDGKDATIGERHKCRLGTDVAFIVAKHPSIQPLKIASTAPQVGERLEIIGFGGPRRKLRNYYGTVLASNLDTDLAIDCNVAAGDSGGAVVNSRGEVVTVVSAGDSGEFNNGEARAHPRLIVPRWTPVRNFLQRVRDRLAKGPGGDNCPDGNCPAEPPASPPGGDIYRDWYPPDGYRSQPAPQNPPPPAPLLPPQPAPRQPLPQPGCDCDERWNNLDAWQGQVDKRIDQVAGRTDDIADQQQGDGDNIDGILGVLRTHREKLDERTTPAATYGWTKWALAAAGITGPLGLVLAGVTSVGVSRLKKRISERRRDPGGSRTDGF